MAAFQGTSLNQSKKGAYKLMPRSSKKAEPTATTNKAPANLKQAIAGITADIEGDNELSLKVSAANIANAQSDATKGRQDSAQRDKTLITTLRTKCDLRGQPLNAEALDTKKGNGIIRGICHAAIIDVVLDDLIVGIPPIGRTGPLRRWDKPVMQHIKRYRAAAIRKFEKRGKENAIELGMTQTRKWLYDMAYELQTTATMEHAIRTAMVEFQSDERRRIMAIMVAEEKAIIAEATTVARKAKAKADRDAGIEPPTKEENAFNKRIEQTGKALDAAVLRLRDITIPEGAISAYKRETKK